MGVARTKVFIINAIVIGVMTVVAISLPVLLSDPKTPVKPVTQPDNVGASRLKPTYEAIPFGNYKHMWRIEVVGYSRVSWTEIFNEWQENEAEGREQYLTWSFSEDSALSDGMLVPKAAGLTFVRVSDPSEGGIGVFKAEVKYKGMTIKIEFQGQAMLPA